MQLTRNTQRVTADKEGKTRHARLFDLAVAVGLSAAIVSGVQLAAAEHGTSTASSFVPIVPCRLTDTRAASQVGSRNTPLDATETVTLAVWGSNGNCSIPASATGITSNVTAVDPSAAGFLTAFPAGGHRPLSSNLNWAANDPPTANQVTVGLSQDGTVNVYNSAGTVDVIIDIVGYYAPAQTAVPARPSSAGGPSTPTPLREATISTST
jgi:hypothetical protein